MIFLSMLSSICFENKFLPRVKFLGVGMKGKALESLASLMGRRALCHDLSWASPHVWCGIKNWWDLILERMEK